MSGLGEFLLLNSVTVTLMAAGAALAGRFSRRPALVHGLWVLVLVKLFTPPLFEVGVLPGGSPPSAQPLVAPLVVFADLEPAAAAAPIPAALALVLALWLAATAAVLAFALSRARRLETLLRDAREAAPALRERTAGLAAAMGLRRAPEVRIVPARISPMLWYRPGSLQLLLPAGLSERLDAGELDALLAHELAHVRRRDHWIRYLELLATTVFWWHPVVWWARLRLRRVEEQCCDAWVLKTMDAHPRVYAQALLKTLEFLAGARIATPALACGAARTRALKERLTMIMKHRIPESPSRAQFGALALVALVALLVFPTWADRDEEQGVAVSETVASEPPEGIEARLWEKLLALDQQAAALEQQLHGIRAQQAELKQQFLLRHGSAGASAMALDQAQLQRELMVEHLQQISAELDRARSVGAEEAQRLDQLRAERQIEIEASLGQAAEAMGDVQRSAAIRALEEQIRALKEELGRQRRAM